MDSKDRQSRRDFLRHAVMLAGAGVTAPLWAAMKFDRNAVLRYFCANAAATAARVKAGIEANRKGDMTLLFTDAQGRPCENVHVKVRQTRHDFKYGANLFGREWRTNFERDASGGRLSFRGFCGTYEVEATSNGRTVKREFHVGREKPRSIGIVI